MRRTGTGLGTKVVLAMVVSMAILLTAFGLIYGRFWRIGQEHLIHLSEDQLAEIIRRSTYVAMLRNDREDLSQSLLEIGRMPQMQRVRVYDKTGTIRYSSHADEVGQQVDMSADACDRCHASAQPLTRLEQEDRTRIYRVGDHRVMATIHAIPNEPSCHSAPCHVHPPDLAVLGVLDVQMSLAAVDAYAVRWRRSFFLSSLLILVVVSGLSYYFVHRTVNRPVRLLLRATSAVSAGDLEQRIPVRFDSEINELVRSFNRMTEDLHQARQESENWAHTLERRVEEKSAALQRAQDEMVHVEKMASLGKLAAVVAHEINNPLAGIRTYARLLIKKLGGREIAATPPAAGRVEGEAEASESRPVSGVSVSGGDESLNWLRRIESEAGRCGEIVRNLLAFSRSSQPRVAAQDLNNIVRDAVALVQHQFDLAEVRVRLELDAWLGPVACDPPQIKQALLAVLINACEAMPQGGDLLVTTSATSAPVAADAVAGGDVATIPANRVEIRVQDNGIGMDEETRKHVFEPFFTTKEGTAAGGTGLGLSVAYTILRSHGGTMTVDSSLGRGSTFVFYLPCPSSGRAGREEQG